jgi:hypothetical protein
VFTFRTPTAPRVADNVLDQMEHISEKRGSEHLASAPISTASQQSPSVWMITSKMINITRGLRRGYTLGAIRQILARTSCASSRRSRGRPPPEGTEMSITDRRASERRRAHAQRSTWGKPGESILPPAIRPPRQLGGDGQRRA